MKFHHSKNKLFRVVLFDQINKCTSTPVAVAVAAANNKKKNKYKKNEKKYQITKIG